MAERLGWKLAQLRRRVTPLERRLPQQLDAADKHSLHAEVGEEWQET